MARILVVDDTPEILNLVRKILSDCGHEILTAENAMDAMEILNSYRVDLGIFDIELPYTNGFQFASTLRNSLRYKLFPIIFLTGRKEKRDVERAKEVKAEGYILKPIHKEKLIEAVDFVINKIPPSSHKQLDVSKTVISEKGQVIKKEFIKIKTISDIGILVHSTNKFKLDEIIELNSNLFHEINIPAVPFKVVGMKQLEENLWEVKLAFIGLNYESVQKLRSWILSQDMHNAS